MWSWWPTVYTSYKWYNVQPYIYSLNLHHINNTSTTHLNSGFSAHLHGNRGRDYVHVMTAQEIWIITTVFIQNTRDVCRTSNTNSVWTELFSFSVRILKQFTNAMMPSKKYIFGWLHNEFCFVHCSNLLYIAASLQLHICNRLLLIQIQQEHGSSLTARKLHTEQENSVTPVCSFEHPNVMQKGCTFSVASICLAKKRKMAAL